MPIRLPLIILGWDAQHLLSVRDSNGRAMVPIFDDPELAEHYRRWYNSEFPAPIHAFLIQELEHTENILKVIALLGKATFFPYNPSPGPLPAPCLCYELDDLLVELSSGKSPSIESGNGQSE